MKEFVRHTFVPGYHNKFHPHFFRQQFVSFFLILNLLIGLFNYWYLDSTSKNNLWLAQIQNALIIDKANESRFQEGLEKLRENPLLEKAAQAKADDMANKSYFSHTSPDGKKPWDFIQEAGYNYSHAGENLAINFIDSEKLHQSWMKSESHRKNILHKEFSEIGIGQATGLYNGQEAIFIVQMFGRQSEATKKSFSVVKNNAQELVITDSKVFVAGNYLSSLDGQLAGPDFPIGTTVYVNSLGLNKRSSPGGKIIGQVKKNTIGQVVGQPLIENGTVWIPITFSDQVFNNLPKSNVAGLTLTETNKNELDLSNQIVTNQNPAPKPILNPNEINLPTSAIAFDIAFNVINLLPYLLMILVIFGLVILIKVKKKKTSALVYGLAMLTTVWGIILVNVYFNRLGNIPL